MVKNIFRLCMLILAATTGLVIITPVLSFNSLLYPVRIDSAYVNRQQILYEKHQSEGATGSESVFIYSPEQLKIPYMDISYTLRDSIQLRGWMALDTMHTQSPLLLILPDITEGAIDYISAMKQFCLRGFNVCVINLRGQGSSEGSFYTPGSVSSLDVKQLIRDLRAMPFIGNVALMGSGTGAGIALKTLADSAVAEVLILQNIPVSLSGYFKAKAVMEWGEYILPLLPALIRSYEDKTGISLEEYNYRKMVKNINLPVMMVTANFMNKKTMDETLAVYGASTYYKKRLYIDAVSFGKKTSQENEKAYYDKLAAFINSSLPSKSNKTRFRKLAIMPLHQ